MITVLNDHIQKLQYSEPDEVAKLVNTIDEEGKPPLQYAAYYNYKNLVLYLLTKGANWLAVNRNGKNIFHIACYMGHVDLISLVVNYQRHVERM